MKAYDQVPKAGYQRAPFSLQASDVKAILVLLGIAALAYFNIIFLGQTLVASADYHPFDYRWDVIRTGGNAGPAFTNFYDLGGVWWQWEPAASFFSTELRKGRIPLWDPTSAGGVDTHVELVQGQYYPPYLLLLLLGNGPLLRDCYYLLELVAAGIFSYFLFRANGFSPMAGVAAGASYMLGGSLTQTLNSILGQSFAVLPAMVWSMDYLLKRPTWRRVGISGLCLACCGLSSFMPVVISGYLLTVLYVTVRGGGLRAWLRAAGWGAAAVALSLALMSFLLIPVQIVSGGDPTFRAWYRDIGLQAYPVKVLLTLVSPSISFDQWQNLDPAQALFSNQVIGFFYCGLTVILLALLARPGDRPDQRRVYWFFLASTIFLILKLLGVAPVQWIAYLPVFNSLHFAPYFCGALNFAIAGLAGIGVETVISRRSRTAALYAGLALIGLLLAVIRFDETQPVNPGLQGAMLWGAVIRHGLEVLRLVVCGAAIALVLTARRKVPQTTTAWMLVGIVVLELAPMAYRTRFLRSDVWRNPPEYVRFLKRNAAGSRAHGIHDLALTPNVGQGVGVRTISSRVSFNSGRYEEIVRRYFKTADLPYPLVKSLLPSDRRILDVLNVKYLVMFAPSAAEVENVQSVGLVPTDADGQFRILQNPTSFPSMYVARKVRMANNPAASLAILPQVDPGEVVLEDAPSAGGTMGSVEELRDDLDAVTAKVRADSKGVLVFSENSAPGWQATVNGNSARILVANHAFQAVEVPAGISEVKFRYRPAGLFAGLAISACALAGCVILILLPPNRERSRIAQ